MEMALIRFNRPLGEAMSEIDRIRREIDRVFSEGAGSRLSQNFSGVFPPVNVYEGKDHYMLTAELPSVKAQDLEITATDDSVTLKGERQAGDGGKTASYHRRERGSGQFRRIVTLPDKVDSNLVEATTRHGILFVKLPKAEHVKPRHVQVKVSD
jgi:HSP20 family protein